MDVYEIIKICNMHPRVNILQPDYVLNRIHEIMKENNTIDNRRVGSLR